MWQRNNRNGIRVGVTVGVCAYLPNLGICAGRNRGCITT